MPNQGPDGQDVRDSLLTAFRRARWGLIAGVWGSIFVFDATRQCIDSLSRGRPWPLAWMRVSASSLALWALVTPLLLWLGRRVPLERNRRPRVLAMHAGVMLAIALGDAVLQVAVWGDGKIHTIFLGTLIIDAFSYVTVVALGHVQRSNALYRERVRAEAALAQELTTARLRALEMQLHPHFLFNTLHAVGALIRSARADDAVNSLAALGGLLRATLADGEQHEIALGDELALAHRYLELQKLRFADRLRVAIDIAPEVERARVPRLILQPLLENAVRHGVERSRTAVTVEVCACARGGRLELIVRDRGGTREPSSHGHGIGLANTRARLSALYGAAHRLELTPTEGGGLAVRIEIPLASAPVRQLRRELAFDAELGELEAVS